MAVNSKAGTSTPYAAGNILSGETLTLDVTTGNLASHGATIPNGTTQIICIPDAAVHFANNKDATSTVGFAIAATKAFVIDQDQIVTMDVIADADTPGMAVVYLGYPGI